MQKNKTCALSPAFMCHWPTLLISWTRTLPLPPGLFARKRSGLFMAWEVASRLPMAKVGTNREGFKWRKKHFFLSHSTPKNNQVCFKILPCVYDSEGTRLHTVDTPICDSLFVANWDGKSAIISPDQINHGAFLASNIQRGAFATIFRPSLRAWKFKEKKLISRRSFNHQYNYILGGGATSI